MFEKFSSICFVTIATEYFIGSSDKEEKQFKDRFGIIEHYYPRDIDFFEHPSF